MLTKNQLTLKKLRIPKIYKNRIIALNGCPQKKGTCTKVTVMTPRKPNSAIRKVVRLTLSNRYKTWAYIPGCGHNLQKHSTVLIKSGRVKDLPGMKYKLIRGKYDLRPMEGRRRSRSKYGIKKIFG
jgi:small subunit ribosomal protein S12